MATRTLHIIDCALFKSGVGKNGTPWALYDVTAVNPDGAPIEEKLKSFEKLEGVVEVEIEREEHERYGVSYLLKSVGRQPSPGARLGPKVDELRERIEALERRVDELEGGPTGVPYGSPPPAEPTFGGEEVPF